MEGAALRVALFDASSYHPPHPHIIQCLAAVARSVATLRSETMRAACFKPPANAPATLLRLFLERALWSHHVLK